MKDKTIVFRTYSTLPEAQYAKDALEQNGVDCFLSNQIMSQLYPIFGSSLNGIRLIIRQADLPHAEDILKDAVITN